MRIYVVIILDIILVIGRGDKQRIKVDDFHAKFFEIIHLFEYTREISAVELIHAEVFRAFFPGLHFFARHTDIKILIVHHVIGRIRIVEAIDEDLIHDRAFCPVRR